MAATSVSVLSIGDWGYHRFVYDGGRAKTCCGAKLVAKSLKEFLSNKATVKTWLSKEPTLETTILKLELLPKLIDDRADSQSAKLRIVDSNKHVAEPDKVATPRFAYPHPVNCDRLVIHDAGGEFREHVPIETLNTLLKSATASAETDAAIFVHVCGDLPEVEPEKGERSVQFTDPLWKALDQSEAIKRRVHVICSSTPIRKAGCAVSRRLSWEQTVEDLASELFLSDQLRALSRFGRLTIRLGHAAAVHLDVGGRTRKGHLIFAPEAKDGIHRDPAEEGRVIGKCMMILASLLSMQTNGSLAPASPGDASRDQLEKEVDAIKFAMRASMHLFDKGYTKFEEDLKDDHISAAIWSDEIKSLIRGSERSSPPEKHFVSVGVPCSVLRRPPGITGIRSDWEILRHQINAEIQYDKPSASLPTRVNIGTAIVLFGVDRVLNRTFDADRHKNVLDVLLRPPCVVTAEEPGDHVTLPLQRKPLMPDADAIPSRTVERAVDVQQIVAPIGTFGNLITVERDDIESFRSIQNLLKMHLHDYVEQRNRHHLERLRPLSIAVFGPPGSGKSFAVNQIVGSINLSKIGVSSNTVAALDIKTFEANLSQYHSVHDLEKLFRNVHACLARNTSMPLVFFDEFDSEHANLPLGWLKHFLAPMQDGKFCSADGGTIDLFGAVFVFAGGTYSRFVDFDPSEPPGIDHHPADSVELLERMRVFRERKGPDFVSRLRGHMNIHSVDAPDGHTKHIIRRALTLRGILNTHKNGVVRARRNKKHLKSLDMPEEMPIDHDIVYALLTVDRYKHGARSMAALLEMCTRVNGHIQKVSLPSRAQLNMHVDADEFFVRMHRGRFRGYASAGTTQWNAQTNGLPDRSSGGGATGRGNAGGIGDKSGPHGPITPGGGVESIPERNRAKTKRRKRT